jgi:hypothetical protein
MRDGMNHEIEESSIPRWTAIPVALMTALIMYLTSSIDDLLVRVLAGVAVLVCVMLPIALVVRRVHWRGSRESGV